MPITPFHFGPGVLIKSVVPKWFSLRAFILSQIVIDSETAWNLLKGNDRLHTVFHSYLGSLAAMLISMGLLLSFNLVLTKFESLKNLSGRRFELRSSTIGVFLGGWSHVFLDSIMHSDLYPFFPINNSQPQLAMWSLRDLHSFCLWGFVAGGTVLVIRAGVRNLRPKVPKQPDNFTSL
jgi:hypothetical protein